MEEPLDHVHPGAGHVAHAKDGHDVLLEGVAGGGDAVVAALDDEGDLVGADRLEQRLQRVEGRLQLVVRRRVHLGDHDEEGHLERLDDGEVLLGHGHDAGARADHEHGVVRGVAR